MNFYRLIAAVLAALALSACIGGAIIPVPIVDSGPRATYTERYYYPDGTVTYYRDSDRY